MSKTDQSETSVNRYVPEAECEEMRTLADEGLTAAAIGERLDRTAETVHNHVKGRCHLHEEDRVSGMRLSCPYGCPGGVPSLRKHLPCKNSP